MTEKILKIYNESKIYRKNTKIKVKIYNEEKFVLNGNGKINIENVGETIYEINQIDYLDSLITLTLKNRIFEIKICVINDGENIKFYKIKFATPYKNISEIYVGESNENVRIQMNAIVDSYFYESRRDYSDKLIISHKHFCKRIPNT